MIKITQLRQSVIRPHIQPKRFNLECTTTQLKSLNNKPIGFHSSYRQKGSVVVIALFFSVLLSLVAMQSINVVNTELNILTENKDNVVSFYSSENYALEAEAFIEDKKFLQTSDELHEYDFWDTDDDLNADVDLSVINWESLSTSKMNDFDGTSAYIIRYLGGRTLPGEGMNDRSERIYGSVMDYFVVHSFSKGALGAESRVDTVYSRYR